MRLYFWAGFTDRVNQRPHPRQVAGSDLLLCLRRCLHRPPRPEWPEHSTAFRSLWGDWLLWPRREARLLAFAIGLHLAARAAAAHGAPLFGAVLRFVIEGPAAAKAGFEPPELSRHRRLVTNSQERCQRLRHARAARSYVELPALVQRYQQRCRLVDFVDDGARSRIRFEPLVRGTQRTRGRPQVTRKRDILVGHRSLGIQQLQPYEPALELFRGVHHVYLVARPEELQQEVAFVGVHLQKVTTSPSVR